MLPNRCHSAQPHLEKHGITPFQQLLALFPLNRSRRLCRNIIHNSVDILYLVNDTCRDHFQHLIRDACEICGHKVGGGDATQRQGIIISSAVAHNAYRTHIGQHGEILVDAPIQTSLCDLFPEDPVGILENGQLFVCDLADDADRQTRTRSG